MARLDLQHLEQRFKLRVEHEQSGLPLPPRHEVLAAQPPPIALMGSVQNSFCQLQNGMSPSAATVTGMVASAPWLQPSSHANGATTNPSVAAAAAAGIPNIMNPSSILNQLGSNAGQPGMVLPGTHLPFTPSSAPTAAAQSTIASFQNPAAEVQNDQSQLAALQQLLLQLAAAKQRTNPPAQSTEAEQQRYEHFDFSFCRSYTLAFVLVFILSLCSRSNVFFCQFVFSCNNW